MKRCNLEINNDEGDYREAFVTNYLQPNEENVLEVFEMAINLNMFELKQQCLDFLRNRQFKDLSVTNDKLNVLTETPFAYLMKEALHKESSNAIKLQEYEEVLCKYFQNKFRRYLHQLFNKSNPVNLVLKPCDTCSNSSYPR